MTTYFIADMHYNHNNIIEYEQRPYENKEEMKTAMIHSWNSVVTNEDTVVVVGDFVFGSKGVWTSILSELKGSIILVKGNHDHTKAVDLLKDDYFKEYHNLGYIFKDEGIMYHVSHYPLMLGMRKNMINIHGHIHRNDSPLVNQINVGVDSSFMKEYYQQHNVPFATPVPFSYIAEQAKTINDNMVHHR